MKVRTKKLFSWAFAGLLAGACAFAEDFDTGRNRYGYGALFGSTMIDVRKGLVTSAMARVERDMAHEPHNSILHLRRGNILMREGDWSAAAEEFRTAARMRPEDAIPHGYLGYVLLLAGQFQPAVAEFTTALQMHKPQDLGVTYALLSLALEAAKANEEAVTSLTSAFKAAPPEFAAELLGYRCHAAAQIGLIESAQEACDESIHKDSRYEWAYEGRALLDLKTKQYSRAIADYTQVLYLDPDNVFALYGRSLARHALHDAGETTDRSAAVAREPRIAAIFSRAGGLQ